MVTANALAGSRIVMHSNAASFLIRTILCENTKILLSKNYFQLGKMNARFCIWSRLFKKALIEFYNLHPNRKH